MAEPAHGADRVTYVGHATVLIELDGVASAPVTWTPSAALAPPPCSRRGS